LGPKQSAALHDSNTAWQAKVLVIDTIVKKTLGAPEQVKRQMHVLVPAVIECLNDTKQDVQEAAKNALSTMGNELIQSPEMKAMVEPIVDAIIVPTEKTTECVEQLMDVTFINAIDSPCLSMMVPVLSRALKERRMEYKKKASMVVGNMCGLVLNGKELVPHVPSLLPELVACVKDSNPEMRQYGGTALSALLKGMAQGQLGSSFDVLLTDLERFQKEMVSPDSETRNAAEKGLQDLIEKATNMATKTHTSEEELKADLENLKIEEEKKAAEAAAAEEEAKRKEEKAEEIEKALEPVPGQGFCPNICRECPQCQLAIEEQAKKDEEAKKVADKEAKKQAKLKEEEAKKKAFAKYQEEQKKLLAKQKGAKKKK